MHANPRLHQTAPVPATNHSHSPIEEAAVFAVSTIDKGLPSSIWIGKAVVRGNAVIDVINHTIVSIIVKVLRQPAIRVKTIDGITTAESQVVR